METTKRRYEILERAEQHLDQPLLTHGPGMPRESEATYSERTVYQLVRREDGTVVAEGSDRAELEARGRMLEEEAEEADRLHTQGVDQVAPE